MSHQIEIDCVPYDVTVEDGIVTIHDCLGSILGKLNNDPAITGNRYSDERIFASHYIDGEDAEMLLHVDFDDDAVIFDVSDAKDSDAAVGIVADWINDNFYCIESIGYETLKPLSYLNKYRPTNRHNVFN